MDRPFLLLVALAHWHVALSGPTAALVFSAGFTDDMVLAMSPSQAAIYGLVFPSSSADVSISVTLDSGDGAPVHVVAAVTQDGAGSGSACDAQCYSAGYICAIGLTSCCSAPSCPMGCAIAGVVSSTAACIAQCKAAKGTCDYVVPNSTLEFNLCGDCQPGCGCEDYEQECEAGCGFAKGAPAPQRAWKALLPAQPAGGAYTLTATCTGACDGGVTSISIERATFGMVFYASGQSNMALGVQHSFRYKDDIAEIQAGRYSNIRFFQYGGMGDQEDATEPAWATTAMTFPEWPWMNLSKAVSQPKGYASFQTFSALSYYFATSLSDRFAAGGATPPPIGVREDGVRGKYLRPRGSHEQTQPPPSDPTAFR